MDGVKQGFGQFWWTSGRHAGDKYVGQFRADRRHGYGQYSFANGNVYDGNWVGALQQARWQIQAILLISANFLLLHLTELMNLLQGGPIGLYNGNGRIL